MTDELIAKLYTRADNLDERVKLLEFARDNVATVQEQMFNRANECERRIAALEPSVISHTSDALLPQLTVPLFGERVTLTFPPGAKVVSLTPTSRAVVSVDGVTLATLVLKGSQ